MNINLGRIYYPVTTLGPGKRVGIWVCGCPFNCKGCLSSEFKNKMHGKEISIDEIMVLIRSLDDKVEGITISGGEPFYQPKALLELLKAVTCCFEDIIVFTGYKYEELLSGKIPHAKEALDYISLLIDGKFDEKEVCSGGLRGSSNQKIIQLKNIYEDIDFYKMKKKVQIVYFNNNFIEIGIPGGD